MKFSKTQRRIILKHLPEDLRKVFFANDTMQTLQKIGGAYELSKENRATLGEAVGLVLLGTLNRKEYQDYLYEQLPQDKETIDSIIKETQPIFQPVSGQLERLDPEKLLQKEDKSEVAEGDIDGSSMPVPPPPPAPGSGYGGASDPYREPPE